MNGNVCTRNARDTYNANSKAPEETKRSRNEALDRLKLTILSRENISPLSM